MNAKRMSGPRRVLGGILLVLLAALGGCATGGVPRGGPQLPSIAP